MAARLATSAGKKLYKSRATLVEPAFAQFSAGSAATSTYRGRDAVTEIKLLGAVHDLGKLLDHRRRHPALAT
jgi:Transposase DDE domain